MDWHNQWSTQNLVKALELTEYHCWKWLHLYLMMRHTQKAIFPSTAISNSSWGCSCCSLHFNIPSICESQKHSNGLVLNSTKLNHPEDRLCGVFQFWQRNLLDFQSKRCPDNRRTCIVHFSTHLVSPHTNIKLHNLSLSHILSHCLPYLAGTEGGDSWDLISLFWPHVQEFFPAYLLILCPVIYIYTPGAHLSTQGNKTNNLTFGAYYSTQIFNVNSDKNQDSMYIETW